jgi:hypothetical protein
MVKWAEQSPTAIRSATPARLAAPFVVLVHHGGLREKATADGDPAAHVAALPIEVQARTF